MSKINFEALVEKSLARLGWLATSEKPTLACAHADDDLPYGWVRVSDDYADWGCGNALEIASALDEMPDDSEYGENLPDCIGDAPTSSRDWPEELIDYKQLEEGTCNDNPNTLIIVSTNAGIRYAAGPHGVFNCALSDQLTNGELDTSEEAATSSLQSE